MTRDYNNWRVYLTLAVIYYSSKSSVVRWHSFQTAAEKANRSSGKRSGMPLMAMSCGQLQVIRKLGLVTLTGYMERYCPTHRSGWNWELPKFIKKIKMPDYKDKRVFGVPLVITLQRSGQALPKTIQAAMNWLKAFAMDHIGLFRKSGVKSRIAKVKAIVETSPDCDSLELFEGQQPYDVADMIKQYFRDLPESLFTNKLAETFVAIFQRKLRDEFTCCCRFNLISLSIPFRSPGRRAWRRHSIGDSLAAR